MYIDTRFEREEKFWTVEADKKQWKIVGPWEVISVDVTVGKKETTIRYTTNITDNLGFTKMLENDKMFRSVWEAYKYVEKAEQQIKESEEKMDFSNAPETASEEEMLV